MYNKAAQELKSIIEEKFTTFPSSQQLNRWHRRKKIQLTLEMVNLEQ